MVEETQCPTCIFLNTIALEIHSIQHQKDNMTETTFLHLPQKKIKTCPKYILLLPGWEKMKCMPDYIKPQWGKENGRHLSSDEKLGASPSWINFSNSLLNRDQRWDQKQRTEDMFKGQDLTAIP